MNIFLFASVSRSRQCNQKGASVCKHVHNGNVTDIFGWVICRVIFNRFSLRKRNSWQTHTHTPFPRSGFVKSPANEKWMEWCGEGKARNKRWVWIERRELHTGSEIWGNSPRATEKAVREQSDAVEQPWAVRAIPGDGSGQLQCVCALRLCTWHACIISMHLLASLHG